MSNFSQLPSDQALKLIAFPFQVGMWISHADDVDGDGDDESEMRALEEGIPVIAAKYGHSALIGTVSQEILRLKDQWEQWEEASFHVLRQAPDVLALVRAEFGDDDARDYRDFVLDIGKKVARAHNEFNAFDAAQTGPKTGFIAKLMGALSGRSTTNANQAGSPANISAAEKSALIELANALKIAD